MSTTAVATGWSKAVALKLVPLGSQISVVALREKIALTLEVEVDAALSRQRAENFPELSRVEAELARQRKEFESQAEQTRKQLKAAEDAIAQRERAITAQEAKLVTFRAAFYAYAAWLNGDGEVDENAKRFNALRAAVEDLTRSQHDSAKTVALPHG